MGDCQEHFTYDALNKAFTLLIQCDPADRNLFALGAGYVLSVILCSLGATKHV